jgi:hypothetical protein
MPSPFPLPGAPLGWLAHPFRGRARASLRRRRLPRRCLPRHMPLPLPAGTLVALLCFLSCCIPQPPLPAPEKNTPRAVPVLPLTVPRSSSVFPFLHSLSEARQPGAAALATCGERSRRWPGGVPLPGSPSTSFCRSSFIRILPATLRERLLRTACPALLCFLSIQTARRAPHHSAAAATLKTRVNSRPPAASNLPASWPPRGDPGVSATTGGFRPCFTTEGKGQGRGQRGRMIQQAHR